MLQKRSRNLRSYKCLVIDSRVGQNLFHFGVFKRSDRLFILRRKFTGSFLIPGITDIGIEQNKKSGCGNGGCCEPSDRDAVRHMNILS